MNPYESLSFPGAVVSSAVRSAGEALQFASPALRNDRSTVRQAVQQMGGAIWWQNDLGKTRENWGKCAMYRLKQVQLDE